MRKITLLVVLVLVMGFGLSSLVQDAQAGSDCFVQITIKSGTHDVKIDGREIGSNLGPGRYTLECKCMGPIVWIDGQLISLYPNQRYGNVYKIKVGR